MKIQCQNCKYEWETTSKMEKVTCPNCGYKTPKKTQTEQKKQNQRNQREVKPMKNKKIITGITIILTIILITGIALVITEEETTEEGTATITTEVLADPGEDSNIAAVHILEHGEYTDPGDLEDPIDETTDGHLGAIEEEGDEVEVDPDNTVDLVVEAEIYDDEVAFESEDNQYAYFEITEGVQDGHTENTLETGEYYMADDPPNGYFLANNRIWNEEEGFHLEVDEELHFEVDLWVYLE